MIRFSPNLPPRHGTLGAKRHPSIHLKCTYGNGSTLLDAPHPPPLLRHGATAGKRNARVVVGGDLNIWEFHNMYKQFMTLVVQHDFGQREGGVRDRGREGTSRVVVPHGKWWQGSGLILCESSSSRMHIGRL